MADTGFISISTICLPEEFVAYWIIYFKKQQEGISRDHEIVWQMMKSQ